MLFNIISWVFLAYTVVSMVRENKVHGLLARARTTYFESGALPYLLAPLMLVMVVAISVGLSAVCPAWMTHGWSSLLSSTDQGNATTGALASISSSDGRAWQAVGLLGVAVLLVVLPTAAAMEENVFRRYITSWPGILKASATFGLVHMVMGISLCTAIALMFGGLVFALFYRWQSQPRNGRGWVAGEAYGYQRVSALHGIYNAYIMLALAAVILV